MATSTINIPDAMKSAAWKFMRDKFPEVKGVEKLDFYTKAYLEGAMEWLADNPPADGGE